MANLSPTQQTGQAAEAMACDYLQKQGLRLVVPNYRCRLGEIDLIMQDEEGIVFVEVRYRNSLAFGGGLYSVTASKQNKLLRTARYYLQQKKLTDTIDCRFDVIAITSQLGKVSVEWVKNAF